MSTAASLPIQIDIFALWTGFAYPPQVAGRLALQPAAHGHWTVIDEMTLTQSAVSHERVVRLMSAIADVATQPEPARFGRTADELEWHFGSCTTDDSPSMLVELRFADRQPLRLKTKSNHAHLLPWSVTGTNWIDNFNPEISLAIAALLPDGWLFKERLHSSDWIFDSEKESRARFAKLELEQERVDQPRETYEQQTARLKAAIHKVLDAEAHGEETEFARGKRDYTANQLRRLSAAELGELAADGFDLSNSDETGQTALMLAAFPPFRRDQFENLVSAGADVNARRSDSMTGLMLACAGGMEDTVPFWLNAGAQVELRGPNGCTALMLGAGYPGIVQALLERGPDVAATDNDGDSALDYAIDDQCPFGAGRRLHSIDLLARAISRVDLRLLQRSLARAIENARKARVHEQVSIQLRRRPASDNIRRARELADDSEAARILLQDLDELIDLEISEIELADRIVAVLREVATGAGP